MDFVTSITVKQAYILEDMELVDWNAKMDKSME